MLPWQPQVLRSCIWPGLDRMASPWVDCSAETGGLQKPSQHIQLHTLNRKFKPSTTKTFNVEFIPAAFSVQPVWTRAAQNAELFVQQDDAEPHRALQLWVSAPFHLQGLMGKRKGSEENVWDQWWPKNTCAKTHSLETGAHRRTRLDEVDLGLLQVKHTKTPSAC